MERNYDIATLDELRQYWRDGRYRRIALNALAWIAILALACLATYPLSLMR